MKFKLLHHPFDWSNILASYLTDMYAEHFDLEAFDDAKTYDKSKCIIYTDWINSGWTNHWHSQGYKVIIDNLWDPWQNLNVWQSNPGYLVIRSNGWFCIANEALWYTAIGLHSYTAKNTNTKDFLMLMNLKKPHRDLLWNKIQPYITNSIYSYNGNGIKLQGSNDIDSDLDSWQRHVEPEWYDFTKYSLVVETGLNNQPMVHSEKVLKPIAFKHPFIVWGPVGYLQWLKTWGFLTFSHCIDESYDLEQDPNKRLDMIIAEVDRLSTTPADYFITEETEQILAHNYARFYDLSWAKQQLEENVFAVIKEWV